MLVIFGAFLFFFFNDTATTEIYTLSLHDALPIWGAGGRRRGGVLPGRGGAVPRGRDRKSTRLNSSHLVISYAVFCLKKKKKHNIAGMRDRASIHLRRAGCGARSGDSPLHDHTMHH